MIRVSCVYLHASGLWTRCGQGGSGACRARRVVFRRATIRLGGVEAVNGETMYRALSRHPVISALSDVAERDGLHAIDCDGALQRDV